ncbi:carbohydrate-binding module family 52 protein [Podospora fimiseda]|uniref:Carbohydrate-binding module family 52 protein n=1 Tax=Podospora fimiseda TaxID=252190 RepID=A0AAN7BD63_9PEZI|nr:carbohydrate-binding module family 52 protein [Podospora fimiseda]
MMNRLAWAATALLALTQGALGLDTCGQAQYDPTQYVCWYHEFLCPVTAGEGLSYCNGSCYSKFMYTCTNNVLTLLPPVQGPFTLTVWNPTLPIQDTPVTAGGLRWSLNGNTSSYCPGVVPPSECPPGTTTSIVSANGYAAMNVKVPGGQLVYLTPDWQVGYTQAHSAYIPSGSITGGFGAYEGGGFVNLNGNGFGWVACPIRASGPTGGVWQLFGRNETNGASLSYCTPINLKINPTPAGEFGAWQYT